MPQIFAVVLSGAFVTMFGFYVGIENASQFMLLLRYRQVPLMIIGTMIAMVGSGLFLLLDLQTSTALWAVFLVICGIGTGLVINLAYTIVQAVLT